MKMDDSRESIEISKSNTNEDAISEESDIQIDPDTESDDTKSKELKKSSSYQDI